MNAFDAHKKEKDLALFRSKSFSFLQHSTR